MDPWFLIGLGSGIAAGLLAAWLWRPRASAHHAPESGQLKKLGEMTGGLAHEIKNPLSTLSLNLQLLEEDLADLSDRVDEAEHDELERSRRRLSTLRRESQRLKDILEDFLQFAGQIRLDREPVDLNELINELVDFFQPQAEATGIRLRTDLRADPATVSVDADLLKQALLNLMLNATQAMADVRDGGGDHGGAGDLIVATERTRASGGSESVCIHVTDTGPGMSPEVAEKVFEPYYSTRDAGTGLGLPTTRRIVEEHGGTVTLHAEPGRGTDFVITLPDFQEASRAGS